MSTTEKSSHKKRGRPPKSAKPSSSSPTSTPPTSGNNPDPREALKIFPNLPVRTPISLAYDDYRSSKLQVPDTRGTKRKDDSASHAQPKKRLSPNGEKRPKIEKEEKRPKIEPSPDFILISDDEDDQVANQAPNAPQPVQQQQPPSPPPQPPLPNKSWQPPPLPKFDTDVLLDHNGNVLTGEALDLAELYWECQREYDHCPFPTGVQGPMPEEDPLVRAAIHRRRYTEAVLKRHLEPGMRTFEPPYIAPPPIISVSGDSSIIAEAGAPLPDPPPAARKPTTLSPEQQGVVDQALAGRNLFYTGSAGCGKSTVLHTIKRRLREKGLSVRVMAPTGIVALAIGGDTTWRFAGWTPDKFREPLSQIINIPSKSRARKRMKQTDVIIIDEISMVENHFFERLNRLLKAARTDRRPFGGLQVIVTGDFCQLPPVKPFTNCIDCGREMIRNVHGAQEPTYRCPNTSGCPRVFTESDKWVFRSKSWEECDFVHINLTGIHRQSDQHFISILQKCRVGTPLHPNETDLLMNHPSNTANAITLYSTREEVHRENQRRFEALKTKEHEYKCWDHFRWNGMDEKLRDKDSELDFDGYSFKSLRNHRYSPRVVLKVGMPVVLLANLDVTAGLCNGSQGIIAGFEPYDPEKLPKKSNGDSSLANETLGGDYALFREMHIKRFCERQKEGLMFPVVRWLRDMSQQRTIMPDCQVSERGDPRRDGGNGGGGGGDDDGGGGEWRYSLLSRTQLPLAPAWALSIHKSQGMTLDRVIVDLSRAFEEGQVYVALSRATSLKGLTVKGDSKGLEVGTGGNKEVRAFLNEKFGI